MSTAPATIALAFEFLGKPACALPTLDPAVTAADAYSATALVERGYDAARQP